MKILVNKQLWKLKWSSVKQQNTISETQAVEKDNFVATIIYLCFQRQV